MHLPRSADVNACCTSTGHPRFRSLDEDVPLELCEYGEHPDEGFPLAVFVSMPSRTLTRVTPASSSSRTVRRRCSVLRVFERPVEAGARGLRPALHVAVRAYQHRVRVCLHLPRKGGPLVLGGLLDGRTRARRSQSASFESIERVPFSDASVAQHRHAKLRLNFGGSGESESGVGKGVRRVGPARCPNPQPAKIA